MNLDNDYSNEVVPLESRFSGLNILFIWMGFIMVVATMSFGGGLASQMELKDLIPAVLMGNLFLAAVAFLSGYIGSHSGLSFASLTSQVFPKGSWKIAVLYIPISLIGWYAIEAAIFGNLIADILELNDISRRLIMAGAALFFSTSAYFGVRFMGKISYFLVPLVIMISLYALLNTSSLDGASFGFSDKLISLQAGTAIVMSTWIFSVLLVIPDLTRFIKKPLNAGIIAAFGVFFANCVALGIGAFAAAYTQQYDPSLILSALGFAPLAILLSFAGIWSTNDNNMYSSALGVSKILNLPRRKVVLGLAILGAIIALFNPATISIMFSFLIFMGASAPALGGIVLGSYLLRKRNIHVESHLLAPWLAWIAASAIAFNLKGIIVIPAGMILGIVFWFILSKILNRLIPSVSDLK